MRKLLLSLLIILTLSLPSFATTVMYGPTNIYSAGGTKMYGVDSNSTVVAAVNSSVSDISNIKGLWVIDETRAVPTIPDLSGNNHTITLRNGSLAAINASTCTPGFSGLAPYLTFDATHVWNTLDHTDFSLTDGAGTDIVGTIIWAGIIPDTTSTSILAKSNSAGNMREYTIYISAADKIAFTLLSADGTKSIERSYNTALTSYQNIPVVLIFTYDGSKTVAGIKIYLQGNRIDDTDSIVGVYAGMTNGTALFSSYQNAVAGPMKAKLLFQAFIKGEEPTPAQILAIDKALRQWAGSY
jgi:hypothetical protein